MSFILHEHLINDFYVFMLMHNYIIEELNLFKRPSETEFLNSWVTIDYINNIIKKSRFYYLLGNFVYLDTQRK